MPVDAYNASIILKCLHTPIMLNYAGIIYLPLFPGVESRMGSGHVFSDSLSGVDSEWYGAGFLLSCSHTATVQYP